MGRFFECQSTSFTFFISNFFFFFLQGAKVKLRLGRDVPDHLQGENPTVGSFINHVDMAGEGGNTKHQMSILLLQKLHLVEWSLKGGGGKNVKYSVFMVYG